MHDHHHHAEVFSHKDKRYYLTKQVTLIGALGNIILVFLKIIAGFLTHSKALIADGLHSLADLVSDAVVLIAAKFASEEADEEHPYGHGRIETAATVGLGVLLVITGVGIALEAIHTIISQKALTSPAPIALWIAILGILIKEGLFQYTMWIAKKVNSPMLKANAWHHRSDALSSVVVVIGLIGALLGFYILDTIAAFIVALMIVHIGYQQIVDSFQELIDTSLTKEKVNEIKQAIKEIDGVRNVHLLRTRLMGGKILVDVHVQVSPYISVSEGHHIADLIACDLLNNFHEIHDVTIHIDPEDDRHFTADKSLLPSRQIILDYLHQYWSVLQYYSEIQHIQLHFIGDHVVLEVFFPLNIAEDFAHYSEKYLEIIKKLQWIKEVHFLFKMRHNSAD